MCKSPRNQKYAGGTLGDMGEDVLWWCSNYQPKPFKGLISEQDEALRKALDAAQAELTSAPDNASNVDDSDIPF